MELIVKIFFFYFTLACSYILVTKNSPLPVFIAGDLSGVGNEVIRKLTSFGIPVRALVSEEKKDLLDDMPLVYTAVGDTTSEDDVQSCMNGCVAAIALVSGKTDGDGSPKLDYAGNSNIVEQAGILGVERIVLVTSVGCGESKNSVTDEYLKQQEAFLTAKNRAEKDLRMYTNLEWTVIRPGPVVASIPFTGKAILTTDTLVSGSISQSDLASLIVKTLITPGGQFTRREVTAFDPSIPSSIQRQSYVDFTSLADSKIE